jgi:hypothetical protein
MAVNTPAAAQRLTLRADGLDFGAAMLNEGIETPSPNDRTGLRQELLFFFLAAFALSWSAMMLWDVPVRGGVDKQDAVLKAFERVSFYYAFGPFVAAIGVSVFFAVAEASRPCSNPSRNGALDGCAMFGRRQRQLSLNGWRLGYASCGQRRG